jgi:putative tryptophan/tyrosine transport system permease protein
LEVKSSLKPEPPSVEAPVQSVNLLKRPLARKELGSLVNWGFRLFTLLLSIYLLSQGTKWISAFVFGVGFAAVGIGVYLTFRILNFPDLTIEGSYTLGAAVVVSFIYNNEGSFWGNPWVATLIAMLCGGLAGLATGLLHTRLKINGLLASILVTTGLYSVNLHVLAPRALIDINGKPNIVDSFIDPYKAIFQIDRVDPVMREWLTLVFFLIIALILIFFFNWLLNTQLGLALRATGDNEDMIRALGVNTNNTKLVLLVLSNALFGLAGGMLAQYLRFADGNFGLGLIVIGLAAVILGESFITPRTTLLALLGCLAGAVIYRLLFTGVFGLEISLGLLLRVGLTLGVAALIAYPIYLTRRAESSSLLTFGGLIVGGIVGAVISTWLDALVRGSLTTDLNTAVIFKAEQYDIRLVLSVLVIIAMGVPVVRNRIGMKALRGAFTR